MRIMSNAILGKVRTCTCMDLNLNITYHGAGNSGSFCTVTANIFTPSALSFSQHNHDISEIAS